MPKRTRKVADLLKGAIAASGKTQRAIADEAGLRNANVVSHLKDGKMKLPITRVRDLARALHVEPAHMLDVAMSEYYPDTWPIIRSMLVASPLTDAELEILNAYRAACDASGLDSSSRSVATAFIEILERRPRT